MEDFGKYIATQKEEESPKPALAIYRFDQDVQAIAVDCNGQIVAGGRLVRVDEGGYDPLDEQAKEMGSEEGILLPENGLQFGHYYSSTVVNLGRDPESGLVDSWDVEIVEVEAPKVHIPTEDELVEVMRSTGQATWDGAYEMAERILELMRGKK